MTHSQQPQVSQGQPVGNLAQDAYTSWQTRAIAALIDIAPIVVVEVVSSFLGITIVSLIVWLAVLAYSVWNWGVRQGTTGSTVGKSYMKFRVVSEETGKPLGVGMSLVRQLAHAVDAAIFYIGFLFPLWDPKRQTIADKLLRTVCLPIS